MASALLSEILDEPIQLIGIIFIFESVQEINQYIWTAYEEAKKWNIPGDDLLLRRLLLVIQNLPESIGETLPGSTEGSMEIADQLSKLYRLWSPPTEPEEDGAIDEVRYAIHCTLIGAAGDFAPNLSSLQQTRCLDDTKSLKASLRQIRRNIGYFFAKKQMLLSPRTLPSRGRAGIFEHLLTRQDYETDFKAIYRSLLPKSRSLESAISAARSSQVSSISSHSGVVRWTRRRRIASIPSQQVSDAESTVPPHQQQSSDSLARLHTNRRNSLPTRVLDFVKRPKPCHILILLGFLTIIGSLVPALWRSVDQNDISGGFAMAQYTLGVGAFTVGCIVAIHSRTCTCWSPSGSTWD